MKPNRPLQVRSQNSKLRCQKQSQLRPPEKAGGRYKSNGKGDGEGDRNGNGEGNGKGN